MTQGIPKDVVDFLNEHIDSAVQLEVLLLVHSDSTAAHTSADIARELRIDTEWTEAALSALAGGGVLVCENGSYRFAAPASMTQTVQKLAEEYAQRRVSVISAIFSKPPEPIRQFTDAFRFRKEEDR